MASVGSTINLTHLTPHCRSLTICPADPYWERALTHQCDACQGGRRCTRELSLIADEEDSPYMHPSLPIFLTTLSSLETLRISWHNLDWSLLPNNQRQVLIRLISLGSLEELEIIASRNFPLELIRVFCGSQLHLTFSGDIITGAVVQPPVRFQGLLALSLVGQRKMVVFMDYAEDRPEFRTMLRGLESLCITCVEDDQFESGRNLEVIGYFLRFLDESKIRELRVQDERPNAVIGHTFAAPELRSLQNVWTVETHLSIKNPLSPHEIYCALRDWITPLLSNLINSTTLKSLDITYQVIFPQEPEIPDGLIEKMKQLWWELDEYLARGFPVLEQVYVGFQFCGVGEHERWMQFNAENQPTQLDQRGVDCSFWVRDI